MLKINKLYSEPEVFDPIFFEEGFNLILGETTEGSKKTNGVGKSLAIEFINFSLLKRYSDSRVSLIPKEDLALDTVICLDFEINGNQITSRRTLSSPDCPVLIVNGKKTSYSKVSD